MGGMHGKYNIYYDLKKSILLSNIVLLTINFIYIYNFYTNIKKKKIGGFDKPSNKKRKI